MILGYGNYKYKKVDGWYKLPEYFYIDQKNIMCAPTVACDSKERVFVFTASNHPVTILNKSGGFVSCWGEGHFMNPHGIFINPDDTLLLVDRQSHVIEKYTPDGKLLLTIGERGWAQPPMMIKPFNLPTHATSGPNGDIFASDGYGNNLVHRFSPEGELIKTWGGPGKDPGQFNVPHSIAVDKYGTVYVLDRENHRIQLFTQDGEFITMWTDFEYPEAIYIDQKDETIYIAEGFPGKETSPRVTIRNFKGNVLSDWGGRKVQDEDILESPHSIWVDSSRDIYIAECEPGIRKICKYARI